MKLISSMGVVGGAMLLCASPVCAQTGSFVVPVERVVGFGELPPSFVDGEPVVQSLAPAGGMAVRVSDSMTRDLYVFERPGAPRATPLTVGAPVLGQPGLFIHSFAQEHLDANGTLRARLTLRDASGTPPQIGVVELPQTGPARLLLASGSIAPAVAGATIAPSVIPLHATSRDGWVRVLTRIAGPSIDGANDRVLYAVSPQGEATLLARSGDRVGGWGQSWAITLPAVSVANPQITHDAIAMGEGVTLFQSDVRDISGAVRTFRWHHAAPGRAPTALIREDGTVLGMDALAVVSQLVVCGAREDGRLVFVAQGRDARQGDLSVAYAATVTAEGLTYRELARTGQPVVGIPGGYSVTSLLWGLSNATQSLLGDALLLATVSNPTIPSLPVLLRARAGQPPEVVVSSGFTRVGNDTIDTISDLVTNDEGQAILLARVGGRQMVLGYDPQRGVQTLGSGALPTFFGLARTGYGLVTAPTTADGRFVVSQYADGAYLVDVAPCSDVDFDNDGIFPSDNDLVALLSVLAGGECATCDDIDFNGDGIFPSDEDLAAYLRVLAGGVGCG